MPVLGLGHVATITQGSDRLEALYREAFGAAVERDEPEFPGEG